MTSLVDETDKGTVGLLITDPPDRRRYARCVRALGYKTLALTPNKARLSKWDSVDMVLTDHHAARMLAEDLQALKRRAAAALRFIPFVIVLPLIADFAPLRAAGFSDLIKLPATEDVFATRIEAWLRAAEATERRYRSLVEESAIGIYRTAPDGRIRYANPSFAQMLGFASSADLIRRDRDLLGFVSEVEHPRFLERLKRESPARGVESAWVRADGTPLYVRVSVQTIPSSDGNVLGYEGTVKDITARVELEKRMAAIRELGRTLVLTRNELEIAQATVEAARDVLGIEDCELFLVDPDQRKLVFGAHTSEHAPPGPVEFPLDAAQGIMACGRSCQMTPL